MPYEAMLNFASTMHLLAPLRIAFTSALCPRSNPIAPSMMDFPAPVSPVMTEKPGSNAISSLSISA